MPTLSYGPRTLAAPPPTHACCPLATQLGYGSGSPGRGPIGMKKRRDGDAGGWSGSQAGGGGGRGSGYGWQQPPGQQRPVPFTRATLSSSIPSSYNRPAAEVVPPPVPPPAPPRHPPPYSMRAYPGPDMGPGMPMMGGGGGGGGGQAAGAFGMHALQAGLPLGAGGPGMHGPPAPHKRDFMTAMDAHHHHQHHQHMLQQQQQQQQHMLHQPPHHPHPQHLPPHPQQHELQYAAPPPSGGALDLSGLHGSLAATGFVTYAPPQGAGHPPSVIQPPQPPQHQQEAGNGGWSPWGGPQQQPVGFSLFHNP